MSERLLLGPPPIYTNLTYNGRNNANWVRWFQSVKNTISQFFKIYGGTDGNEQYVVFLAPNFTTTERDALSGVENGSIIYNTTTNQFNFYENNAWVTK